MIEGNLTAKQDRYARLRAAGKSRTEAYRGAYCALRMSDVAVRVEAARLEQDPAVTLRIATLRKPRERAIKDAVDRSLNAHLRRLADLREGARKEGHWDAAIRAEINIGVACGHYPKNVNVRGSFDHRHQVHSEPVSDTLRWLEEQLEASGADSEAEKPLPH